MTIKLTELFAKARVLRKEKRGAEEVGKLGNLRAGSSGIFSASGESAGHCLRKAHVRQLGLEIEELAEDKLIMFDLGFASEDIVVDKLTRALEGTGKIVLCEEQIPIEWRTSSGTKVTGRPDAVICEPSTLYGITNLSATTPIHTQQGIVPPAKPELGIELKSVHSIWTARDVLFGGKPKLSNIIQAAHYMWKLNVPYKLVYTGYSQLGQGMVGTDSWVSRMFPKQGQPMSEYVDYNKDKGTIKHIKQFEIVYDMRIENGVVEYKPEMSEKWVATIVTIPDIERFFEKVSQIPSTGELGPRPSPVDTLGKKAGYMDCDYCPLKSTCDTHEKSGYNKWLEEVKKVSSSLQKK